MASLQPLSVSALGHRRAAHLLRRTSFRYTKARVDELAALPVDKAVASLLQPYPLRMQQPLYPGTSGNIAWLLPPPGQAFPAEDSALRRYVMGWWVSEALHDAGIVHRMTLFLHQYLTVDAPASNNAHFFDYLSLLRWGALGNFKKLATKIVTDNCMLRYLNNHQNTKNSPNENFAREFFELFTIGKGPQIGPEDYTNYTEHDVIQAARVFTGFRVRSQRDQVDPETGIPRGITAIAQHDTGPKTFSSKFQNKTIQGATTNAGMWTELDALVNMVFAQPEVSRLFCRRLYRFFVSRYITPEIETDIIEPLAQIFRNSGYEIKPVLEKLLQSKHFYDEDDAEVGDEIIGGMIRSPLEATLQMMSFFNVPLPDPNANPKGHYLDLFSNGVIQRMLTPAGFPLFMPNDVAGYPAYYQEPEYSRQWFNSSTIIARYKLPEQLLTGRISLGANPNAQLFFKVDLVPWVRNSGFFSNPSDPYKLVDEMLRYLLPTPISPERFNYFYDDVFLNHLPPYDWTYEWQDYLKTNNPTEVRIPLERLLKAILYSQEFQTF
ncbi:MAG: DUF1800 family protein [Saprospiraceae bacterium]|nr:DUF1800 domain-containing protein [Saprospiraceae bacterium]MDW8229869.1 DUF1800 family protein [Saprospiraceae bacterium]